MTSERTFFEMKKEQRMEMAHTNIRRVSGKRETRQLDRVFDKIRIWNAKNKL